ncbi:MAG: ATP-binding cassette domain-containing protein [Proteobacteria bacterium]|nr:ATP-binding cassette domain-containing protein [Pseudomonadota bacterium]
MGIESHLPSVPRMRQNMGMVFQSFNLFAHLTVLENLTIGPIKLFGKTKDAAEKKAIELLKLVGLAEKADSFADELSGGQKQRIAIARCLSMEDDPDMADDIGVTIVRNITKNRDYLWGNGKNILTMTVRE